VVEGLEFGAGTVSGVKAAVGLRVKGSGFRASGLGFRVLSKPCEGFTGVPCS